MTEQEELYPLQSEHRKVNVGENFLKLLFYLIYMIRIVLNVEYPALLNVQLEIQEPHIGHL